MSESMAWRIRGARVIDPYRRIDSIDEAIWVVNGRYAQQPLSALPVQDVDAQGLWLVPRLVDMHVHFREPGQTWKETIETGSRAAAHGGVAAVGIMPNTTPVIDTPELVEWETFRGSQIGLVRVLPFGAISVGSRGDDLVDLHRMFQAGARAFSDDGRPVERAQLMRAALTYAQSLDAAIINHAEDRSLSADGAVHEGWQAHRLGIPGVPETAEAAMVWRDVLLAGLTGGRLHVAHVSAKDSLEAVMWAKSRGFAVTAEAAPHHLLLTDDALAQWGYNPVTKVNPPLRPEASRQALLRAIRDGVIDVLASDHAPHHRDEKARPYVDAPFGISGIETILAGLVTALIDPGLLAPLDAFALMTTGPDRVLKLGYPGIAAGASADFSLIDPLCRWQVDPEQFESLGKNTPLAGMTLIGRAEATMVNGRWTMRDGEVQSARISQIS